MRTPAEEVAAWFAGAPAEEIAEIAARRERVLGVTWNAQEG